jgi:multiple sugar transport system permease protein
MRRRIALGRIASYTFITITSLVMIYPVLFMVLGSFTTGERFIQTRILPIPNTLNLELFARGFLAVKDAYLVTLVRVGFYLLMNLMVGLVGGYVFSKLRFPGRNAAFLMLLMVMVMPAILMIVPQFLQMAWWPLAGGNNWLGQGGHGLIDAWPVLFAYGWVPPFAIFLLKQNYDMLPNELQEAAQLEGAGTGAIIFRVYGPLLKPAIAALVVITFLNVWNDYLWPSLTILGNEAWHPISFRIQNVSLRFWSPAGGPNYPAAMVQYFMAMWPAAAVYFIFQRHLVQGLAAGMKG